MSALAMHCAIRSDVGQRANNEDSVFASPRLAAVADGVGGAAAGEVASRTVINALIQLDNSRLRGSLEDEFREAIRKGNDAIAFVVSCRPELGGMGTTLTAVALSNDGRYLIANIGDSRAYLYRDESLSQLTHDASLVQMLVDEGAISEDAARDHPQRSVVLEALDGQPRDEVALSAVQAIAGDRLLLCSDGLSDIVTDDQISSALADASRETAAERLIALALEAGGKDNISVLVADVEPRANVGDGWLSAA